MMYSYFDYFKPKKRRYLKSFRPPLLVRRHNYIRLSGAIAGLIDRGYRLNSRHGGYVDKRDYLTDLACRGLDRVTLHNTNQEVSYKIGRILDVRDRPEIRYRSAKLNLLALNLKELDTLCRSMPGIDLYDLLSFLITIGEEEVNGGVYYNQESSNGKIYS